MLSPVFGILKNFSWGRCKFLPIRFPNRQAKNDFSLYAADVEAHANLVECHVLAGTLI